MLVWLLSDVDRLWKPEIPYALPVAYAMKGYSLDSQTMRKMCHRVLRAAHDKGIHIVCSTFDGQWISLAVRDDHGNPLTLIQLQRDTEAESRGTSRNDICQYLKSWKPSPDDIIFIKERGVLQVNISSYCNKGRGADLSAYHKAIFSFRERKSRDEFSPSLYFFHVNLICIYK